MPDIFHKIPDKKSITVILLVVLCLFIYLSTLPIPIAESIDQKDEDQIEVAAYYKTNTSLLPEGYTPPQVLGIAATKESSIVTVTPTTTVKPTIKITTIPTSTIENIDFTPTSTVEGRDSDRVLIFRLLKDSIEEYLFYYGQMPKIYVDKSSTPLTKEPSELIYFYNDTENRTNALSINLGSESYVFSLVDNCDNEQSSDNIFAFAYSTENKSLILCKESGDIEEYGF